MSASRSHEGQGEGVVGGGPEPDSDKPQGSRVQRLQFTMIFFFNLL